MAQWSVPGYSEVRLLGSGATGRVVLAIHDQSQHEVAIKYLASRLVQDPEFLARFRDEARLLTELDVPQIVRLYEYAEDPARGAAIVMEFVNGASLHEMISHRGPTGPESALAVLKGSLLGLAAAHAMGVVHRDYKPENVLVDMAGASKLADFGVAVKAGRRVPSAGTPLYMAPEQWEGAEASPATDIYAATAVFYECLTGEPPFSGRIGQLRREHESTPVPAAKVDEPLQRLVARGMAKDPADRPADAALFVAELEQVAQDAYGSQWEERGREHLAERAAALSLLLIRGSVTGATEVTTASTWLGRNRARVAAVVGGVIVLAAAGTVSAVAASGAHSGTAHTIVPSGPKWTTSVTPVAATLAASASVKPATQMVSCGSAPPVFTFSGTVTAGAAATVTYHWALSNGTTSGPQQLTFPAAGEQAVKPYTFTPSADKASGSGTLVVTSPVAAASNKAAFSLTCTTALTATVSSSPVSPATFPCGSAIPGFTVTGAITATQAAVVTYQWERSNGSATAPATVSVGTGQTVDVTDQWTPAASPFSGTDTLDITAPVAVSMPISLALSCTGSHVTGISINPGSPSFGGNAGTAAFVVTITTDGTSPVTLSWQTSQNFSPSPGTADQVSGSKTVSGSTSYTVDLTGTFSPACEGGNPYYWVLDATATGTDGHGVSAVSSVNVTPDCD